MTNVTRDEAERLLTRMLEVRLVVRVGDDSYEVAERCPDDVDPQLRRYWQALRERVGERSCGFMTS